MMLLGFVVLFASIGTAAAAPPPSAPADVFARLKQLAGEWRVSSSLGYEGRATVEVLSDGFAIVQRFHVDGADASKDMLTVFNLDGSRLVLTHFCAGQVQVRMAADRLDPASPTIEFRFLDILNLRSPQAGHMHDGWLRLDGEDSYVELARYFEDGEPKWSETITYRRVKQTGDTR